MQDFVVREMVSLDYPNIQSLANSLTEWFDPQGREMIARDIHFQRGFIAEQEGRIVGFILFYSNQGIVHLAWMGVDRTMHRHGIGTALLERMIEKLHSANATEVHVSTLGDSVDYEPYERTRAFYLKHGFVEHERIRHNRESMPEELILKRIL